MKNDEINSIFISMKLMNKKLLINDKYIFFTEFQDLKDFFISYDVITSEEIVHHYENIFDFKFIHKVKGILYVESYTVNNTYKYNLLYNNQNETYITLKLSNMVNNYELEIIPYSKVFVKK